MRDYEVGYGKPPQQHQFKRGQSGNKRGRRRIPSRLPTPADILAGALNRPITISRGGGKEQVRRYDAYIDVLIGKSLAGSASHMKILNAMIDRLPEEVFEKTESFRMTTTAIELIELAQKAFGKREDDESGPTEE